MTLPTEDEVRGYLEKVTALCSLPHGDGMVRLNARSLRDVLAALVSRPASHEVTAAIEAEARRFAAFYPEGSDARNTFILFAEKIAALSQDKSVGEGSKQ